MATLSAQASIAQTTEAPPAETLDFTMLKGRMTVPVEIGEHGPFDFVIDTGAERSVISHELASRLQLRPSDEARLFDFLGASPVRTVRVPGLTVGQLTTSAIDAPALYAEHLGAYGMLGIDALQGRRVTLDFGLGRMEVAPARKRARGDIIVEAEGRLGQLIVTDAEFEGQPIAVVIDTGSWLTVGNQAMLALAKKRPRKVGAVSVTAVTGRTFATDLMAVDGLRIGSVRLQNVGISFANVAPFDRFGLRDRPAMILGMSTLGKFRKVEIDFANREIGFFLPKPPIDFSTACRPFTPCRSY